MGRPQAARRQQGRSHLDRHGLTKPRRTRRPPKHPGSTLFVAESPNAVWDVDCKDQFRMGNGELCYPLMVCDDHSRFILSCHGLSSVEQYAALKQFDRLLHEYELPTAIRSDNGTLFMSTAIVGLSRLNVLWTGRTFGRPLGIAHQRIQPGGPDQNGQHERMHRTLKAETTRPPEADRAAQQVRFDGWRAEFNAECPHEALGGAVPASLYRPSGRAMPSVLPEPQYPGYAEIRRVSTSGAIKFKGRQVFVSEVLALEAVALTEVDDGLWSVHVYERLVGRLDERDFKLGG